MMSLQFTPLESLSLSNVGSRAWKNRREDVRILNLMSYKSIKDWPEEERPRKTSQSWSGQSIKRTASRYYTEDRRRRKSAMDLAMEMLDSLKNLKNIESASMKELAFLKESAMQKQLRLRLHLNWEEGFYGT